MNWIKITPEVSAGLPAQRVSRLASWSETPLCLVLVRSGWKYENPDRPPAIAFGACRVYDDGTREWYAAGYNGSWIVSHYCPIPALPSGV